MGKKRKLNDDENHEEENKKIKKIKENKEENKNEEKVENKKVEEKEEKKEKVFLDLSKQSEDEFLSSNGITLSGENILPYIQNFSDVKISKKILSKLENKKISKPTLIQSIALPNAINKRDLIGIAETGSGKTLAFMVTFKLKNIYPL
jgi:ATP-dependent helicase YprA (DUF1998 family)